MMQRNRWRVDAGNGAYHHSNPPKPRCTPFLTAERPTMKKQHQPPPITQSHLPANPSYNADDFLLGIFEQPKRPLSPLRVKFSYP